MNYRSLVLLCVLGCAPGLDLEADVLATTDETAEKEQTLLTAAQLDELLAPIALYPDPLVAIILPAATFPADVVMAARYLKAGGDLEAVEDQSWDDSVKALARYPDVMKWMDENLAWTQQVGSAFLLQPAAVLTGTQRLRAVARAAGNLKDTPEQTVVVERETIRIVPAQPEVIYVPVYDPVYVYRPRVIDVYYPAPLVTFSTGYRTGFWLSYHCDWGYNTVVVIGRRNRVAVWQTSPRWSCPPRSVVYDHHVWCPPPARVQRARHDYQHRAPGHVSRPTSNSSYVRHDSVQARESASGGVGISTGGNVRPGRTNNNPVANRPATPAVTPSVPSTGTVAQRPTRTPDSNRFGQNPETRPVAGGRIQRPRQDTPTGTRVENTSGKNTGTDTVSVSPVSPSPFRGDRGQGNRHARTSATTTDTGASVTTTPAPASAPKPARPVTSMGSGLSRRPQPGVPSTSEVVSTSDSSGAAPASRSRPSPAPTRTPGSNRFSSPTREPTATPATPRRESENRTSSGSSPFDRSATRPSANATQSTPTSRMRNPGATTTPANTTEAEASVSRPRR